MIKPARGYVLISPEEADEVSAGGVILPDRIKDMPQKGKVLAVGASKLHYESGLMNDLPRGGRSIGVEEPCEFKVGDIVIFKRFVDNRIKEDGKELLLVKFEDILGVYEKNN